uniref:GLOBIN domain-containing protein n=1 Tax=Trichuris muris TaxID=70415 RepID=A0A5S6QWA0_TRIMR
MTGTSTGYNSHHNNSTALKLTNEEVALLSATWKKDDFDWLYQIGTDIYSHVFDIAPELKVFFPYVIEYEKAGKDWKESKGFRTQALRFVQILGLAVEKAESKLPDDESSLHKRLYTLGEYHRRFALKGFKPAHWSGFCAAVKTTMQKQSETMDSLSGMEREIACVAWEKLSRYIVQRMEQGYFGK